MSGDLSSLETLPTPRIAISLDSRNIVTEDVDARTFKFDLTRLQKAALLQVQSVSCFIPAGVMNPSATNLQMSYGGTVSNYNFDWTTCTNIANLLAELDAKTATANVVWDILQTPFFDGASTTRQLFVQNNNFNPITLLATSSFVRYGGGLLAYYEAEDIVIPGGGGVHIFEPSGFISSSSYYFVSRQLSKTHRGFCVGNMPNDTIAMINGLSYDTPNTFDSSYFMGDIFTLEYSPDETEREVVITVLDQYYNLVTPLPGYGPVQFAMIISAITR